jgi:hypothetical protein
VDPARWPYLVYDKDQKPFDQTHLWNPTLHIKPMRLNAVGSAMMVSLRKMDSQGNHAEYVTALTLKPLLLDAAAALWDAPTDTPPRASAVRFVDNCLTGCALSPLPRVPAIVNGVPLIQLLYQQGDNYDFAYQRPQRDTGYQASATMGQDDTMTVHLSGAHSADLPNRDHVLGSLTDAWVDTQRGAILGNLNLLGFTTEPTARLGIFATRTSLTDWPQTALLGQFPGQPV